MDLRWFVEEVESLAHTLNFSHELNDSDIAPAVENALSTEFETLNMNGSPEKVRILITSLFLIR